MNDLICYENITNNFGPVFRFPDLGEQFKDVTRMSDHKSYSVNCLACRENHEKEEAELIKSTLSKGIKNMGYDTRSSLKESYENYDKEAKKFSFSRMINPFARGKTRTERFTFLPYVAILPIGVAVDISLPALGIKTGGVGVVEGTGINTFTIIMSELIRRGEKKKNENKRDRAFSIINDPKTPFFSDFLEYVEDIEVKFTRVDPAVEFVKQVSETSANDYIKTIDFGVVNNRLNSIYQGYDSQPKT